ncbi:DNA polymerase lambda isoform X2 [Physcomitrium patens]|uniref:DNA polymerase lambda n=1 Tax=Physcomitrium patens TaxID=3218 RepID=A0A2K1JDP8_PHYPA|nr:hypothetical protein PHYPA_019919 [Physcomitrium patens]
MKVEKKKRKRAAQEEEEEEEDGELGDLYFRGIAAYFVETGIQPRRLQIWKQKLLQLGGVVEDHWSEHLSHVFAASVETVTDKCGRRKLKKSKTNVLKYTWIEDCLKAGKCLPIDSYVLDILPENRSVSRNSTENSGLRDNAPEKAVSSSLQKLTSSERATTSDWMQIINEGGEMGVVSKGLHKKETEGGGLHNTQGASSEEDCDMKNEAEASSAELAPARDAAPGPVDSLKNEPEAGYTPPNLNAHITGPFSEIKDIYKEALGDDRRAFSYYKALSVLEKVPFKITSVNQIKGFPTIGKSLMESIHEILSTGRFSKLEHLKNDNKVRVLALFGSVWGIGPATAQRLYDKGLRTLEELKTDNTLTPPQRIGLMFHNDIITKIPRHEIKEMEAIVQKSGSELCPGISIMCGGSYRRGKALSGDMDFVITHPDGHSHTGFLHELVRKLKSEDFLTEDLRIGIEHSTEGTDHGVDTWFGLCKYPGREMRHRVDFKVYPFDQYPFGLIAWTGNDILNRRLRLLAEAKGYSLDDHGLYPIVTDANGGKVKLSVSVPCKSECEVFEKLGFPWLEPHERNL